MSLFDKVFAQRCHFFFGAKIPPFLAHEFCLLFITLLHNVFLAKFQFHLKHYIRPSGGITTIFTRRQEQGFVSLGALRGVFGFGSLARSALVKWNVRGLDSNSSELAMIMYSI
jgi:hypothetical protein